MSIHTIRLQLQKRAICMALSPEVLAKSTDEFGEYIINDLERAWTVGLHKRIPLQTLRSETSPADWWEAVKDRWAPAWFLKKYPVCYKTVSLAVWLDGLAIPPGGKPYFEVIVNGASASSLADSDRFKEHMAYCLFCKQTVPVVDESDNLLVRYEP